MLLKSILLVVGAVLALTLVGCDSIDLKDPIPSLVFSPSTPLVGQMVSFHGEGSRSQNPSGRIERYEWFVDGYFRGSGQILLLRFGQEGSYTIFLRVTDNWGRVGEIWTTLQVNLARLELSSTVSTGESAEIFLTVSSGVAEVIIGGALWTTGIVPEPLGITWDPDRLWLASVFSSHRWEIRGRPSQGNMVFHARRHLGVTGMGLVPEFKGEVVATFQFRTLAPGPAVISLSRVILRDKWGDELPYKVVDGLIDVR